MRNLLKLYISSRNLDEKPKVKYNSQLAMQYLKWLKYTSQKEQERIDGILNKKSDKLTDKEISQLKSFKDSQNIIPIFERYLSNEYRNSDLIQVYDFMKNHSLYNLMLSKLTKEEINSAQIKIEQLSLYLILNC